MSHKKVHTFSIKHTNDVSITIVDAYLNVEQASNMYDELRNREDYIRDGSRQVNPIMLERRW